MKNVYLKSLIVSAMSVALMLACSFQTGCTPSDAPADPDARVPKVPASARGGEGGSGAPGAAGDFKKKTESPTTKK